MATIKYIDKNGETHYINQFKVNNVNVVGEKGSSNADVMSQKAVTDELNKLLEKIESIDLTEELKEYEKSADVNAKLQNYYTKEQSDELFLKEHQSLNDYFTKEEIEEFFKEINSKDLVEFTEYESEEIENGITIKVPDDKKLVYDCGKY